MKTPLLPLLLPALALGFILVGRLDSAEPNESNLTLLDTESPPIRDLAKIAGDEGTYIKLEETNKIGVFFSERVMANSMLNFPLLKRWENSWKLDDFHHSSSGPMFFMNDGRYQVLPTREPEWLTTSASLGWYPLRFIPEQFRGSLNNPDKKIQVFRRLEFPTDLKYPPRGSGPLGGVQDYDKERAEVDASASKLVIVIHGWNPDNDTDPCAKGYWPDLMKNLNKEIRSKSSATPN